MPVNTNKSIQYEPIQNLHWEKISQNPEKYYIEEILPQLKNYKKMDSFELIRNTPQIQVTQFCEQLLKLLSIREYIAQLFMNASIDFQDYVDGKTNYNQQSYHVDYFFKNLNNHFKALFKHLPKRIFNGVDYMEKIKQFEKQIPTVPIEGHQSIQIGPLTNDIYNYFGFSYQIIDRNPANMRQHVHEINHYQTKNETMAYNQSLLAFNRLMRFILNLELKIVQNHKKKQIVKTPPELLNEFRLNSMLSNTEYKYLLT